MKKILSNQGHHFIKIFVALFALHLLVLGSSDTSRPIKSCFNGGTILSDSCACTHGYTGKSCEISFFEDIIENADLISKTRNIRTKTQMYFDFKAFDTWKETGHRMKRGTSEDGSGSGFTSTALDSTTESNQDLTTTNILSFTTETNLGTTAITPTFLTESIPDLTTKSSPDFTTEGSSDFTTESISYVTTGSIQDFTTETITDSTTGIQDSTVEDIPDSTTANVSDFTTESTLNFTTKTTPDSTTADISEFTTKIISDSTTENTLGFTTEKILHSTTENIPDSTTEDIPDSTMEDMSDFTIKSTPDVTTTSILDFTPTSVVDYTELSTFAPLCLDGQVYSRKIKNCTYAATFLFRFTINNEIFRSEYLNIQSPITRVFVNRITLEIQLALTETPFISIEVRRIRKGSVIVDADISFEKTANLSVIEVGYLLLEKLKNPTVGLSKLAVEDKNECIADNICGSNAICTNLVGSFSCVCSPGFVETKSTSLSRRKQCESTCKHIDCTNGGTCITTINNIPLCNCPDAYHGNRCQYSAQQWRLATIVASSILLAVILIIAVILAVRYCRTKSVDSRSPDIPLVTGFKSTSDDDLKTYSNPYQVDVEIFEEHSLKQGPHSDNGRLTNTTTFKPYEIEDDRL